MREQTVQESMRRLAHDLRRIREQQKCSLQEIHSETKIPLDLLHQFERTALYDYERYNPVYLRLFARTYAMAIGIDPASVLDALDRAFAGRYTNQLAVQFLGEEPLSEPEPKVEEGERAEAKTPEEGERPPEAPLPLVATPGGLERLERPSRWKVWARSIVVVMVVGGLWYLLRPAPAPAPEPMQTDTAAMSMAATDTAIAESPVASAPVLGDTITATVIAAFDKVDPIRIRVDRDLRRPYWIEQGDSMQFYFTEQIILENQLDDIQLRLNGYQYPTDRRDRRGRIVITRDRLQAYLDSLVRFND